MLSHQGLHKTGDFLKDSKGLSFSRHVLEMGELVDEHVCGHSKAII